MIQATLHHTQSITPRLKTFWFKTAQPFLFTPGEYVEMYIKHDADSRGEHRKFTISSIPGDPYLGFTISLPKYSSSFKQALSALQPGDVVKMSEPIGDFVFPKLTSIPVIGIAAGSGITPFMSMVRDPHQANRDLQIIHIVRSKEDVVPLPVEKFSAHILTDQPVIPSHILPVHISPETLFYLAGPERIIDMLKSDLIVQGIDGSRIVTDLFIGAENL